jgi:hypothetical protein
MQFFDVLNVQHTIATSNEHRETYTIVELRDPGKSRPCIYNFIKSYFPFKGTGSQDELLFNAY